MTVVSCSRPPPPAPAGVASAGLGPAAGGRKRRGTSAADGRCTGPVTLPVLEKPVLFALVFGADCNTPQQRMMRFTPNSYPHGRG